MQAIAYEASDSEVSIVNAIKPYAAMLDAIREGPVKKERGTIPTDPQERSDHLKAFSYYHDTSAAAVCELSPACFLATPIVNTGVDDLADDLRKKQTKTLAAGIDVVMAELKETMDAPPTRIDGHRYALVLLYEYPRDPRKGEEGCEWIQNTQAERAALRAAETAVVLASYIRLLGYQARAHTGSCSDVDLNKLTVASGLANVVDTSPGSKQSGTHKLSNPYMGSEFGIAAITTDFELAADQALSPEVGSLKDRFTSHGPAWWLGKGFEKNALNKRAYNNRDFRKGAYPFERIKRVDTPTTFIDQLRVARVPNELICSRAPFLVTWASTCKRLPRTATMCAKMPPVLARDAHSLPLY